MAQLEAMRRNVKGSGSSGGHTMEHFLNGGDDPFWAQHMSPTIARNHDHEEHDHPAKKSVLTKVKEKARKLRHTLSSKKKHGDNATPAWGVSLDDDYDDEDEDPEYYGAPMYESTQAPEDVKQTARQHPREDVVVSDKHVLSTTTYKQDAPENKTNNKIAESAKSERAPTEMSNPTSENLATPETVSTTTQQTPESFAEKLAPIETSITNKRAPESVTERSAPQETMQTPKTFTETVTEKLAPAYAMASGATGMITSKIHNLALATTAALSPKGSPSEEGSSPSEKTYDKGVSVKEYLKHKLEPGEDERALSQVITDAISPKKESPTAKKESPTTTNELVSKTSVVEKVRGAMSSYLAANQPSSNTTSNDISSLSTNSHHHVDEDRNEGRVLQLN